MWILQLLERLRSHSGWFDSNHRGQSLHVFFRRVSFQEIHLLRVIQPPSPVTNVRSHSIWSLGSSLDILSLLSRVAPWFVDRANLTPSNQRSQMIFPVVISQQGFLYFPNQIKEIELTLGNIQEINVNGIGIWFKQVDLHLPSRALINANSVWRVETLEDVEPLTSRSLKPRLAPLTGSEKST